MKSRRLAITAALCLLGTIPAAAWPGAAAAGQATKAGHSTASLLFVQQTSGGELARVRPGVYRLVFRGVSPTVSTFTDRPRRHAGIQGLPHFVRGWAADGFAADPPNAALVIHGAPSSHDVAMLTLSHPRYDRRAHRMTYTAKPLHGGGDKSLSSFSRRGDPLRPLSFHDASLFVDNAGGNAVVQPISFQFVSTEPEQSINIQIAPGGPQVSWSIAGPNPQFPSLQVTSQGAPVLISLFALTPTRLTLRTAGEVGIATVFNVRLMVEAEAGSSSIKLLTEAGPNLQVNANLGGLEQTLYPGFNVIPLNLA